MPENTLLLNEKKCRSSGVHLLTFPRTVSAATGACLATAEIDSDNNLPVRR
jgi:hypothetical protein